MIKLIAFDMDGTFLNSQNDYDRVRFDKIFQAAKEKGIRLVANSGNQYQQIASFFEPYLDDLVIVSEIGAQIHERGQLIDFHHFDDAVVADVLGMLAGKGLLDRCSVSGLEGLYFEKGAQPDFKKTIIKHNFAWKEIDSLLELPDDHFTILTLDLPGQDIAALVDDINQLGQGQVKAVSSGFDFIDMVQPKVNKGTALAFLGQRWGIEPEEMMAFGDSDNDLDMLAYVGESYAMAGSPASVVAVARHQAPSNDDSGVLEVLEILLNE